MLHTKIRGNRSTDSREDDFRRVFTIYGNCNHLGYVTGIIFIIFTSMNPKAYLQFFIKNCLVVSEKIKF